MTTSISAAAFITTFGLAATAAADDPQPQRSVAALEAPDVKQMGGSVEMAVAARTEVITDSDTAAEPNGVRQTASLSPMMRIDLRVRDEVELAAAFGLVTVFSNGPEGETQSARPSNISFGGRRLWEWSDTSSRTSSKRFRAADVGFEFAIPTGTAQGQDEVDAFEYALAGRGGLGPWAWMPNTLGLVLPARVRAQVARRWVVESTGALAGMFPSIGDIDPPTAAAQLTGGARWVLPWVALGMQASAVYNGRRQGDKTQTAVAPSLDTNLCRRGGRRISGSIPGTSARCPVSLSAKFHMNLDAPYGFVRDDSLSIWGLHFGLAWAAF